MKPAIIAVGYNRPDGMKRLLDSIGNAKYNANDIPLIISIDQSDKSDEVERVAQDFQWKYGTKEIKRFPERLGLRKHIVLCGDQSEKYGAVIILEDDLVVAKDFYEYVCAAHNQYGEEAEICGVALYSYSANVFNHYPFKPIQSESDVYLGQMVVTWGQSWTARQWRAFKEWYLSHEDKLPEINERIPQDISGWTRSWGRYFASYMADKDLFYVYPYISRTTCFSDYGEHNKTTVPLTFVQVPLMQTVPNNGYRFGSVDALVQYDAFYERVLGKDDAVAGVSGDEICVDLYNMKTSAPAGKKYVLTNDTLRKEIVASFGLTLRPIELNALNNVPGDQLFLYRLDEGRSFIRKWNKKRPKYPKNIRRLKYEFNDVSWRVLFYYTPREFFARIADLIKK